MGEGSCALGGLGPLILGVQHWREGWVQVRAFRGRRPRWGVRGSLGWSGTVNQVGAKRKGVV